MGPLSYQDVTTRIDVRTVVGIQVVFPQAIMSLHPAAAQLDALEQRQTSTSGTTRGEEGRREEEREQESNLLPDVNLMLSQQESVVNSTSSFQH